MLIRVRSLLRAKPVARTKHLENDPGGGQFHHGRARLRPEDLGLVRTARRSHNQLGLAYQIAFIRLTGRAPGQQPFEILEDLVGYVSCEAKGLAYKFARFWALPYYGQS